MSCCNRNGYVPTEHTELIRRLTEAGVDVPENARIFGPGHGATWRLVDMRGQPPEGIVASRVPAKALVRGPVEIRDEGGRNMVHPAADRVGDGT